MEILYTFPLKDFIGLSEYIINSHFSILETIKFVLLLVAGLKLSINVAMKGNPQRYYKVLAITKIQAIS